MDFCASFGAAIARDSLCSAIREARHCFDFDEIVQILGKEKANLIVRQKSVLDRVRKSEEGTRKIDILVEKWLNVAETLRKEVEELEEKVKTNNCCLPGRYANLINRYSLARQIKKKTKRIINHNKECKFPQFDRAATLTGMEYYPSEGFIYFNSTKVAYDQILEGLQDNKVDMIGLYGMGGCGKTSLAKEVGRAAEKLKLFCKVVFVPVSSVVEVKKIQEKIASWLGFQLEEEEESERARRLHMRLTKDERIFLILDDVWETLDFVAIGIPSVETNKLCRILLTARRRRVCDMMNCQKKIQLSLLTEEEAWDLFQKHAGITDDDSDENLKGLAQEIAKKCEGLPVAIATVASTLKGKTLVEWEEAFETFINYRLIDIEPGLQNPYTCLRLSYDNLASEEAKSLFLLCSLFPEDFEIPEEYLTRYGIGLGLFGDVKSFKGRRNQVSVAINKLKDSYLLLEADEKQCVKMHDVVRRVGLWIAKPKIQVVKGPESDQNLPAEVAHKPIKDSAVKYLWCDKVGKILEHLDFPKLEFLKVLTDLKHVELPNEIFHGMKELRVLAFTNQINSQEKPILAVPESIQMLTNLRCLVLVGWKLKDISFLRSLKRLESLTFQTCSFDKLSDGIIEVANLKLLDLSECEIRRNPYEVIERCSQLEELYFTKCHVLEWHSENTAEFFVKIGFPPSLQRYRIEICECFGVFDSEGFSTSRILSLPYFDASTSNATMRDLCQRAQVLSLGGIHEGFGKNIIPDLVHTIGGDMNQLVKLLIYNSKGIECIVDNTNYLAGSVFSKLVQLRIEWMERMEVICRGLTPSGLFEKLEELCIKHCSQLRSILFVGKINLGKLKVLTLDECPLLTSLFTVAVARSLIHLEELIIKDCGRLVSLIADENEEGEEIIADDNDQNCDRLVFQKLKRLDVEHCIQLEYLIPVSFACSLVQLEDLKICGALELKYAFGHHNHQDQFPYQNRNQCQIVKFPALKHISLDDLPKIIGLFPENIYPIWPSLQDFFLVDCPQLNITSINYPGVGSEVRQGHIWSEEEKTAETIKMFQARDCKLKGIFLFARVSFSTEPNTITSSLEQLCLLNLPELRYICEGPTQFLGLHNLGQLEVDGCGKLKFLFSACIARSLPQLKDLKIINCSQLEQIFEDEEQLYEVDSCREKTSTPAASPKDALANQNSEKISCSCCREKTSTRGGSPNDPPLANQNSGSFNLSSLEQLKIESCPRLMSLFTASTAKTMTSLEDLTIENCHDLKCIIKNEGVQGKKLEEIVYSDQDSQNCILIFPKLKILRVQKCALLEYIFPLCFAKGLQELQHIEICEIPQLKYVFCQSEEDISSHHLINNKRMKFPVLEVLKLRILPNFISICPRNYYATCVSLQRLSLRSLGQSIISVSNLAVESDVTHLDCGVRKDLRLLVPFLNNLESLMIESSNIEGIFHVEGLLGNRKQLTSGLIGLDLHNLPELRYICKGPKQFLSLQNLRSLTIVGCRKLKVIFSSSILREFPLLETLIIVNCGELYQIVEDADEENQNHTNHHAQQVCFPKLEVLLVMQCNKMKYLFSMSTPHEFPKLEQLIINEASQLEQVFKCEQGQQEERVKIMLPKLEYLILVELSSLTDVCQGIELQTVRYRAVHDCPELSLTGTTTLLDLLQQNEKYEDDDIDDHFHANSLILLQMIETNRNSRTKRTKNESSAPLTTSHHQMDVDLGKENSATTESDVPYSQELMEKEPRSEGGWRDQQAPRELRLNMNSTDPENSIKQEVLEGPTSRKASRVTSPIHSEPESSLPGPSVTSISQKETNEEESTNKPLQNGREPKSDSAYEATTSKKLATGVPTTSVASLGKTSNTQVSSDLSPVSMPLETSMKLLTELPNRTQFGPSTASIESLDSNMSFRPEHLKVIKTELASYLNMSLEYICEADALGKVERIVNSLAMESTSFTESIILEGLADQLKDFKECIPKAMITIQSGSESVSCNEILNGELNSKLNDGQKQLKDLQSKLRKTCEKEHQIEMEIQRWNNTRNTILAEKNLLESQLDQCTQAYEKWKEAREELKLSEDRKLKSKLVLAQANARWRFFKESLGL